MKVVLTKDVRDMGRMGATVDVADGHALNYLIPRKLAVLATPHSLQQAELYKKRVDDKKSIDAELVAERLAALAETPITIVKKANEKGHLYDAVDAGAIAAVAELPEETIKLEKPIKELGTFEVPVSFGEIFGKVKIVIEAE
ncbi:50S ribosomal protein L9 [Patescibacteria group bacterium]|nr:50S ribosomal protein L9 [Patescibacteria group bacterium]